MPPEPRNNSTPRQNNDEAETELMLTPQTMPELTTAIIKDTGPGCVPRSTGPHRHHSNLDLDQDLAQLRWTGYQEYAGTTRGGNATPAAEAVGRNSSNQSAPSKRRWISQVLDNPPVPGRYVGGHVLRRRTLSKSTSGEPGTSFPGERREEDAPQGRCYEPAPLDTGPGCVPRSTGPHRHHSNLDLDQDLAQLRWTGYQEYAGTTRGGNATPAAEAVGRNSSNQSAPSKRRWISQVLDNPPVPGRYVGGHVLRRRTLSKSTSGEPGTSFPGERREEDAPQGRCYEPAPLDTRPGCVPRSTGPHKHHSNLDLGVAIGPLACQAVVLLAVFLEHGGRGGHHAAVPNGVRQQRLDGEQNLVHGQDRRPG
uniref:Uncharacterized protein, isoform C n=1 Tax=Drosophila pseudoobscura pseudoobscura TaxID=46245 RepID=A0A0R3P150_DROPS